MAVPTAEEIKTYFEQKNYHPDSQLIAKLETDVKNMCLTCLNPKTHAFLQLCDGCYRDCVMQSKATIAQQIIFANIPLEMKFDMAMLLLLEPTCAGSEFAIKTDKGIKLASWFDGQYKKSLEENKTDPVCFDQKQDEHLDFLDGLHEPGIEQIQFAELGSPSTRPGKRKMDGFYDERPQQKARES
jgi:hypothetical protein